jgi:HPt (histidine-containing phosphotransfer) domain-containing protein
VPPLDESVLDQLVTDLDDAQLVKDIVATYLDALGPRLAAVREALAAGDPGQVESTVHALASASVLVGAVDLTAAGRAAEHSAAGGTLQDIGPLMAAVEALIEPTRTAMQAWLASR